MDYFELKAVDNRYRKKSSWIFPFLTKSKNFCKMRTDLNPFSGGFCGHDEDEKLAPKGNLHRQILLK